MPADEKLILRIRDYFAGKDGLSERRMFGGVAFMLNGNMCCGVTGTLLMLRLGKEGANAALAEPHTRPMDFTGKPLSSMCYVEPEGISSAADLAGWLDRAVSFVSTLPAK